MFAQKTNQRWIVDPKIIYDGALCVSGSHFVLTKQLQLKLWKNRRAASACYYIQFP